VIIVYQSWIINKAMGKTGVEQPAIIDSFTAIDFETSTASRTSICQIGLVRVENWKVTEQVSLLIQPPQNHYLYQYTRVHGIKAAHTKTAPTFDMAWSSMEPYITNQHVIAHNGFAFDFPVLRDTLLYYGLEVPPFQGHCTLKIYKRNLAFLCETYNIPLNHHDALSDAMACAKLFMLHHGVAIH
jgi:DNA polymerase III subunit epsilon